MRKAIQIILIILLIPVFLVAFTVVHELGHNILARLLGDPDSFFYLVRIQAHSGCLGYNIYDQSKLSWSGNLIVSLGGLFATQLVAILCLYLLRLLHPAILAKTIQYNRLRLCLPRCTCAGHPGFTLKPGSPHMAGLC